MKNIFRCFIIGEDKLHIQCAKIIKEKGHIILGIISSLESSQEWALQHKIPYFQSLEAAEQTLLETEFDFLFSVVNYQILSSRLLQKSKYFAINFHDALLPKYAGVHATSWAILNQEKTHGITWHVMSDVVDAGDILKQVTIPIADDETAFSLNLKCYEKALEVFPELIEELSTGTYQRIPQNLSLRSYFAFDQKPTGNGWINWHMSAQDIERLYRACYLGDYPNRFSSLKFKLGNEAFIIDKLSISAGRADLLPGTLVTHTKDYWHLATSTQDLILLQVCSMEGLPVSFSDLKKIYHLNAGACLPSPDLKSSQALAHISQACFKEESYWVEKWSVFNATSLPFLSVTNTLFYTHNYTAIAHFSLLPALKKLALELCADEISLNTVLCTVWLVYLYRISDQKDVHIVFAKNPSVENSMSSFVSHELPYIFSCNENIAFKQAIILVNQWLSALQKAGHFLRDVHYRYPQLNLTRQSAPIAVIYTQGEPLESFFQQSRAALIVEINTKNNSVNWYVDDDKKTLESHLLAVLEKIPGHMETLLKAAVHDPNAFIKDLPLLTAQEYQHIIIDWNPPIQRYSCDKTIHQLFEEQVEKTPHHVAIRFGVESLTYQALNQKAHQLAYYLHTKGVQTETLVAICLKPSIGMIVSILAVLKAGGAYVPIDPEFPKIRIKYILEDTNCQFLLSIHALFSHIESYPHHFIDVEDCNIYGEEQSAHIPVTSSIQNLAYIIYTSGSTGKPKGVMIEHGHVVNLFKGTEKIFCFGEHDVWSLAHSFNFDFSVWEIFGALLHGGTLIVIPKDIVKSDYDFYQLIVSEKITVLNQTPTAFYQLIKTDASLKQKLSLRVIIFGGEALSFKALLPWIRMHGDKHPTLINMYGITETTVHVTYQKITASHVKKQKNSLIGKPFTGRTTYVLDPHQQPLPVGVIGELYVGGTGVARGYLNLSEKNKERFLMHALGERIYKTGDLVRWLPNGALEYIGRKDNQVKIRGFRIELNEIEHALLATGNILQTAVLAIVLEDHPKKLVAFIVLDKDQVHITDDELKQQLTSLLPSYMIPSYFCRLHALPLTSNGKLDAQKLVQMYKRSLSSKPQQSMIPTDKKQVILQKIFSEVFKYPVGIHDDFFELGGDSILAMQVCAKSKSYGIQLSIKNIFDFPVVSKLADHAHIAFDQQHKKKKISGKLPLTPIQQWFFDNNLTRKRFFSQTCLLEVPFDVDITRLNTVISEVFQGHDVFRLRFKKTKQGWVQFYHPYVYQPMQPIHVEESSVSDMEGIVEDLIYQAQNNFDLKKGPLFYSYLIGSSLTETSHPPLLLIVIHHLLVDGVSWRILLEEIEQRYRHPHLIEHTQMMSDPFKSWAESIKDYALNPELILAQAYWEKICQKSFTIPVDFTEGQNSEESSTIMEVFCTQEETRLLLDQTTKLYDVRFNEILIAVLVKVLNTWLGGEDVHIDLESHGRAEMLGVDMTRTVGWFTSLFPTYLNAHQSDAWDAHISSIKEQLRAVPHYGIDYGVLRFICKRNSEKLNYKPQISFNFWGSFDHLFSNESSFRFKWLKPVSHPKNTRPHVISIESVIHNGQLSFQWIYSKNLHASTTIEKLAKDYVLAIKELLQKHLDDNKTLSPSQDTLILNKRVFKTEDQFGHSYLLSPLQKGILFQTLSQPNSGAYVVQFCWKSKDHTDPVILKRAFQYLVNRHEVLRTRFSWEKLREPIQIVEERAELLWQEYDWSSIPEVEHKKRMDDFLYADREADFSLDKAPLLRGTLIFVADQEYWVIFTSHHILLDGWSMSLLMQELGLIYQALKQGTSAQLPNPVSYEHYIHWLQKQDLKAAERFWGDYLDNIQDPGLLENITLSRESNSTQLIHFDEKVTFLSHSLSQRIKQFLKKNKLTLGTFFYGIWGLLLHRYTQKDDILFGTTISLRSADIPESERMLGLLINTLPVRILFDKNYTVLNYLAMVQENSLNLLNYSYASLMNIQAWTKHSSVKSHDLFDTLLVIENYPTSTIDALKLKFDDIRIIDPTHYPLTLSIFPGNQISFKFTYNSNRIGVEIINNLILHIQVLIEGFLSKFYNSIHTLDILSSEEYQRMIIDWNPKIESNGNYANILTFFENQVLSVPNNIAIVFENSQLTYAELNNKANQLAHFLKKQNIPTEALIALCMERSFEMIIGMLAILKIGAAYVPVDPAYPITRIEYILKDCSPFLMLTTEILIQTISLNCKNIRTVFLDRDLCVINKEPKTNLTPISPSTLAYVIYTSGSTGNPKGTLIEHQNVTQLFEATQSLYRFNYQDVWTLFHSFNFDFSVWEIWGALFYGGKLIIVPNKVQKDLKEFYDLISKQGVTVLNITPGAFYKLISIDEKYLKKLALRYIIFGGDVLSKKPLDPWFSRHGYKSPKLINMYGITETTIFVTYNFLDEFENESIHFRIGKPLDDHCVYVLDKHLNPLPINIVGEIFVGGNVGRGYLNNTSLTSEKFIHNPFLDNNTSIMYRSGDLAKWLPNGTLEYVGRVDDQVKIRGFRIELGEIQAKIEKYVSVRQAAIIVTGEDFYQKNLVAYLTKRKGMHLEIADLHAYLASVLPYYMIPSSYILLDEIPLTINGKLDKRSLPSPEHAERLHKEFLAPTSELESNIANLWSKILGISRVSIIDNFFDLGGNSFSVLEIISLMQTDYKIEINIQDFIKNPTVIELCNKIEQLQKEKDVFNLSKVKPSFKNHLLDCLVPLQTQGHKSPLFLIHPVGGTVFWYIPLVKYLDPDRPLYGIQDPGIEAPGLVFHNIEEMAAYYVQAIRSIQPEGPYFLGGASGGATISVEITHQLEEKGEDVAFVALLDGWAPFPDGLRNRAFFESNMRRQYNKMYKKFLAKGIKCAESLLNLQWDRSQLIANYKIPQLYHTLTLFKAIDVMPVFQPIEDTFNCWDNYLSKPLELHLVPGDHETMFEEPQVQILADKINQCLMKINPLKSAIHVNPIHL